MPAHAGPGRRLPPNETHRAEVLRPERQRDKKDSAQIRRQVQSDNRPQPVAQSDV